jgi:4-diphosphocytidyl-2-C-methyl-D-erythritol kinase
VSRTPTIRRAVVRAPAKINLTLRVGPVRVDGYHHVQTVLQSIAIADTVRATAARGPFALAVRAPGVPADRTNLVWRAAERLWRAAGRDGEPRDARVALEKRIPPAAGLGGGSADAAAALVALNIVWRCRQSRSQLARIAATLGADVPFFLVGGTALGAGRGDELYPLTDLQPRGIVVMRPAFGLATADVYRWLDEDRAAGVDREVRPSREVEVGWPTGPIEVSNDLQPPAARRHPVLSEMVEACLAQGAVAASMTGSGSAVFGVFPRTQTARAAGRLRRPGWRVVATRTLTRREAGLFKRL